MKICESAKSITKTNWWVSQLKRVFYLESRWREWVFFFFFLFFCLLLPIYSFFFLSFVIFSSAFCYLYIEKISVFLSLSTFQVINTVFLNEMWYKGLIQKILGCGVFFFFLRKLKIWWFGWISCYFSYFALWEIVRNNLFLLNFQLGLK